MSDNRHVCGARGVMGVGVPLALLVALSVFDSVVSSLLLRFGLMREANPFMELSLMRLGLPATVGAKLLITAFAIAGLWAVRRDLEVVLPTLLWVCCGCYVMLWAVVLTLG